MTNRGYSIYDLATTLRWSTHLEESEGSYADRKAQ